MKFGSGPPVSGAVTGIAVWLLTLTSASGQTAPAKPLMAEQAFKNVTVLKGIPVDEFMDTMGFIAASTNYNCTDCHVEPKRRAIGASTPWRRRARRQRAE